MIFGDQFVITIRGVDIRVDEFGPNIQVEHPFFAVFLMIYHKFGWLIIAAGYAYLLLDREESFSYILFLSIWSLALMGMYLF